MNAKDLYLDLLKRALTCSIYKDELEVEKVALQNWRDTPPLRRLAKGLVLGLLNKTRYRLVSEVRAHPLVCEEGYGYLFPAHTMVGFKRIDNMRLCVERVLADKVPGDLLEAGVWRGGAAIYMKGVLKAHGVSDRRVWVADSFEGLPPPDEKYPADAGTVWHERDNLKVSLEKVKKNFEAYGLLDDKVLFLKGFFDQTLPKAPVERLAILRMDADMYGSTMDIFNNLYDKLSVGGYIIIDDYHLTGCSKAVHDFRKSRGIEDEMIKIDWGSVYWRRSK